MTTPSTKEAKQMTERHEFTPDSYDPTGCAECGEDRSDAAHGTTPSTENDPLHNYDGTKWDALVTCKPDGSIVLAPELVRSAYEASHKRAPTPTGNSEGDWPEGFGPFKAGGWWVWHRSDISPPEASVKQWKTQAEARADAFREASHKPAPTPETLSNPGEVATEVLSEAVATVARQKKALLAYAEHHGHDHLFYENTRLREALADERERTAGLRTYINASEFPRPPDWRCRTCGCLWRDNGDDTVSLFDVSQKSCDACEHQSTPTACVRLSQETERTETP